MGLFGFKKKESKSEFRKEFQTFDISGNGLVLSGEEQELMIHVLEKQGKDVGFDASGVKNCFWTGKPCQPTLWYSAKTHSENN